MADLIKRALESGPDSFRPFGTTRRRSEDPIKAQPSQEQGDLIVELQMLREEIVRLRRLIDSKMAQT